MLSRLPRRSAPERFESAPEGFEPNLQTFLQKELPNLARSAGRKVKNVLEPREMLPNPEPGGNEPTFQAKFNSAGNAVIMGKLWLATTENSK